MRYIYADESGNFDFSLAIFKKWESGDERSYVLIRDKIESEFNLYRDGATNYY